MNGIGDKKFVKFSIGLKGSLLGSVKAFLDQSYVSEDLALGSSINDDQHFEGQCRGFR